MRNQIFLFLSQQHDQKQSLLAEMVFPVYKQVHPLLDFRRLLEHCNGKMAIVLKYNLKFRLPN